MQLSLKYYSKQLFPNHTVDGQVENAEVGKQKYGNGSTEVRRKVAYRCLVHECAL